MVSTQQQKGTGQLYPTDISVPAQTSDGIPLTIRSVQYSDVPLVARFHATLSEQTVRWRYLHPIALHARIQPERLARVCRPDPESEAVLLAVHRCVMTDADELLAVGRLEQVSEHAAELAFLVADLWQHHGIGSILLDLLIAMAKRRGLRELTAYIHRENDPMQSLCRGRGFDVHPTTQKLVRARLGLA